MTIAAYIFAGLAVVSILLSIFGVNILQVILTIVEGLLEVLFSIGD